MAGFLTSPEKRVTMPKLLRGVFYALTFELSAAGFLYAVYRFFLSLN